MRLTVEGVPHAGWIVKDEDGEGGTRCIARTEERARAFVRHVRERAGQVMPRGPARGRG